jgi:hypothetical protein
LGHDLLLIQKAMVYFRLLIPSVLKGLSSLPHYGEIAI